MIREMGEPHNNKREASEGEVRTIPYDDSGQAQTKAFLDKQLEVYFSEIHNRGQSVHKPDEEEFLKDLFRKALFDDKVGNFLSADENGQAILNATEYARMVRGFLSRELAIHNQEGDEAMIADEDEDLYTKGIMALAQAQREKEEKAGAQKSEGKSESEHKTEVRDLTEEIRTKRAQLKDSFVAAGLQPLFDRLLAFTNMDSATNYSKSLPVEGYLQAHAPKEVQEKQKGFLGSLFNRKSLRIHEIIFSAQDSGAELIEAIKDYSDLLDKREALRQEHFSSLSMKEFAKMIQG